MAEQSGGVRWSIVAVIGACVAVGAYLAIGPGDARQEPRRQVAVDSTPDPAAPSNPPTDESPARDEPTDPTASVQAMADAVPIPSNAIDDKTSPLETAPAEIPALEPMRADEPPDDPLAQPEPPPEEPSPPVVDEAAREEHATDSSVPPTHRIDESGRLSIDAASLVDGEVLALGLALPDEARGNEPLPVRVVAVDGRALDTTATLAAGSGNGLRLEIDPEWLVPGRYLIEVRTPEKTHFPLRRYVLEVP